MFGPSEATLDFLRDIRAADDRQWVSRPVHVPTQVSTSWPQVHGGPMGWQCPKCGWCFAPGMPACSNCNRPEHLKTSTGTSVQVETGCPSDAELAAALAVLRKRRYTPEELQALITEAWRVDVESAGPR